MQRLRTFILIYVYRLVEKLWMLIVIHVCRLMLKLRGLIAVMFRKRMCGPSSHDLHLREEGRLQAT